MKKCTDESMCTKFRDQPRLILEQKQPTSIAPSSLKPAAFLTCVDWCRSLIKKSCQNSQDGGLMVIYHGRKQNKSFQTHPRLVSFTNENKNYAKHTPAIQSFHLTRKRGCFTFIRGETYLCLFLAHMGHAVFFLVGNKNGSGCDSKNGSIQGAE